MKVLIEQATIDQAEADFNAQKQALLDQGQEVPTGTPTSTYADKIRAIAAPWTPWRPQPTWWDIEKIVEEDTSPYTKKFIALLSDTEPSTDLRGATAYRTSDGGYYTGDATHLWDTSKDLPCALGYKTRYIICYYQYDTPLVSSSYKLKNSLLYFVVNGMNVYNTTFEDCRAMRSFKVLHGQFVATEKDIFKNCYGLEYVPQLDTTSNNNFQDFFEDCSGLSYHEPFPAAQGTNFYRMYSGARSITAIPFVSFPVGSENALASCYALVSIGAVGIVAASISLNDSCLNHDTALRLIGALVDKIGGTQQILQLHPMTFSQLTPAEIAVATAKNWSVTTA